MALFPCLTMTTKSLRRIMGSRAHVRRLPKAKEAACREAREGARLHVIQIVIELITAS